ncbi:arf-GAP with Rho-GAP domain, ANK repeat and PH domain-containing protein 1-like isoform X3 [Periophthalmus magnuspinnatus]|uniref:arf-GAP with Rho-GAP domain, ANK repeat and PH domain-containing protein 1-like isoform X3 n=1 Tax=Periophthalmus magnuspinnatus TaxID=409849 RepID=UPI002436EC79|nr:arf-GAP with Rho-GAP domain, ANK repeat and PH domain-containing protein 1-like isoform X3 [Periophthalmus magnuspinnatus]
MTSDSCISLPDWLNMLRLEQYKEVFLSAGLTTLQECRTLTQERLEQMGINLPGHQRRILSSLNKTIMLCDTTSSLQQDPHFTFVEEKRERRGDEIMDKPTPRQRQVPERESLLQQSLLKEDGKSERPVPKQRTKYRPVAPVAPVDSEMTSTEVTLPPVPPRSTPNCPPQLFTSPETPPPISLRRDKQQTMPGLPSRPPRSSRSPTHTSDQPFAQLSQPTTSICQTLPRSLPSPLKDFANSNNDGKKRSSPVSPIPSPSEDTFAPPLPPKTGPAPKGPPPRLQRISASPKRHSLPPTIKPPDDMEQDQIPLVPPRITLSRSQDNLQQIQQPTQLEKAPAPPARRAPPPQRETRLDSIDDNSDEYEDPDLFYTGAQQVNMPLRDRSLQMANQAKMRYSALCSDDELLDDDDSSMWSEGHSPQGSIYLPPNRGQLPSSSRDDSTQESAIIKVGWLDKNPPQGALYYQRRWVKLDTDYLRYFDNEKAIYSKGLISTAFITSVSSVGELKFEVVTNNRTFIFRAESEAERDEWVALLKDCTGGRQYRNTITPGSPLAPDFHGYLGLRGIRSRLYTVVALDKVFLYKNMEDYRIGVGITTIDMNVGNVKVTDQRAFDLTTPYRTFCFIAESEQLKDQWVEAMHNAIDEALSNSEVAERIWAEPTNSCCADCGAPKPEWAAINLCVVVCKRCAGEHRGLGPSISKVRSLKMDKKVWTDELIQVFLLMGNERVNSFWAGNVPPSEALTPSSCTEDRRRYITNKYRQGKYRKYHQLFGNQKELNNALCINVQGSDVLETLRLIFCGADVNCSTGVPECPSPLTLAQASSQPLQAELISHNLNTELPRSEVGDITDTMPYSAPSTVCLNGFLFKTASMTRAVTDRKAKEEFSRRWCTLNDGTFSYYESDKNSNPNGSLKASEIVCLSVGTISHGYNHTFELYTEAERLYLFGTDDPDSHKEWIKSIAKSIIPASAESLLRLDFVRIGRLRCKGGLNLETSKVGWFALEGSTLHAHMEKGHMEEINLRKLTELSTQSDVLVLVEKGRTLYIEGERKLDFAGWCEAITTAAQSGADTLSEQQLTETDIPVIVHSCIGFITQYGLTSEGIYRKSGVNSRVKALLDKFRSDARSICLKEENNVVDDVSNTLKRFFRELEEGLFTQEEGPNWLQTSIIQDKDAKISQYQQLLDKLPHVNKATLEALINHLYCVQCHAHINQMNIHNLAIVFGPTLFQTDGKDYTAGQVIEDLIEHYTTIFEVNQTQLAKQLQEIEVIIRLRETLNNKFTANTQGGHIICTVYLEEKSLTEHHVKIPGSMTAAELTWEVLDIRKIPAKDKDYWSCWEINEKEEMERPLHYRERVLPILHSFGTDSKLLIKKHLGMEAMLSYLASKPDVSKHGKMKFRDGRNIPGLGLFSSGFHEKYFTLTATSLRMYKEVTSNRPENEWPVKNLMVYLGIKKKLRPATCWGLTLVCESKKQDKHEKQQWYVCCETQSDLREWLASFLSIQCEGDMWPEEGQKHTRVSRALPDMHHGNVSLIPLRGSENEMRNSVAAFSQDPLGDGRSHGSPHHTLQP